MSLKWTPDWAVARGGTLVQPAQEPSSTESHQTSAGLAVPVSAEIILEALREVEDPELAIGIVDLGLIYGINVEDHTIRVQMTLTSPGCPVGPMLQAAVHGAVKRVYPDAREIKVDLVWSPPWDPYEMATEEAKDMLGIW